MAAGYELDEEQLALAALALLSLSPAVAGEAREASIDARWIDVLRESGWLAPSSEGGRLTLTPEGARKAREVVRDRFSRRRASGPHAPSGAAAVDPDHAIVLRCTAKLLKELRVEAQPVPVGLSTHRDWHATVTRIERRKCVLVSHTDTLFTVPLVGVKRANLDQIGAEIGHRVQAALQREGLGSCDLVLPSVTPQVIFARTNDRSVLGSMVDLQRLLEDEVTAAGGLSRIDGERLTWRLNDVPMYGTLAGKTGLEAMTALLRPDLGAWYGQRRPD